MDVTTVQQAFSTVCTVVGAISISAILFGIIVWLDGGACFRYDEDEEG